MSESAAESFNSRPDGSEEPLEGISPADLQALTRTPEIDGPYTLGPESTAQENVPRGQVSQHHWVGGEIYPGVERDYWVYVPQQYDGSQLACLMVFQDGAMYLGPDTNIPIAFDNLIHQGDMPLTIGLFVNPGDRGPGMPRWGGADNRSVEYDSLDDRYARFLLEELLPPLEQQYNLVSDPAGRAICGISSGGICAFTVAWQRPDAFGKVVSHCGSFTSVRGGNQYPSMIRKSVAKPLRVFLQTGTKDLDVVFGNWVIANQDMAAALAYKDYDYQFVLGEGGHSLVHGGAIFPDTMRWLWRDYPR
ncbi:MAG: esterase family protein [Chloroflexi bacterium]|nr:esterase family protein [Chloroflexota bacterium]